MDLHRKQIIIPLLNKHELWAKKGFGQNFLIDKNILDLIIKAANISPNDHIIEIGPGLGVLTQELAKNSKKVTSIELDKKLLPILHENLQEYQNIEIIQGDALKFTPPTAPYKIVANIPYNITSPLLKHFLQQKNKPSTMTLLVQKEVAQKICEKKKLSILSLQVQLFAHPKIIKTVKPSAFYPSPKIDSAIIHIQIYPKDHPQHLSLQKGLKILKIAKIGFSQKRKKLFTTLKKSPEINKEKLEKGFKKADIAENIRPEDLSIEEWQKLSQELD